MAQSDVRRQIAEAFLALAASRSRMAIAQRAIEGAELTAAGAWERYKEGLGDILNVLDAETANLDARESWVNAQRDARSACVRFAMLANPAQFLASGLHSISEIR